MIRSLLCLLVSTASAVALAEENPNQLTTAEALSGWKLLFDGESTEGWRNYGKSEISSGWKVVDGALTRVSQGAGDIITEAQFAAFELSLQYKISPAGNSGVMFHVLENSNRPWHSGPEIQIQDNLEGRDPQKSGWLYQLYQPGKDLTGKIVDATRPPGQWNQLYIRIAPNQCEVSMNGVNYYRFKLGDQAWKDRVAKSKFANIEGFGAAGKGHICLQDHGDLVAYRNIKVRELKEDLTVPQPIHGKLSTRGELAFPKLKWDGWEPIDEGGNVRMLRLLELTFANDDSNRLFAVSQSGEIFTFENRPDVETSHLFLDLTKKVNPWNGPGANEQGLLGLAMHPDFKSNGIFFASYTSREDDRSVISRFRVSKDNPNQADPQSEEVILEVAQPFKNHNGGPIEFGPDGYLYIGLGDGGSRNDPYANGQDLSTLLGTILRIDVNQTDGDRKYGIPADNPFVNTQGARPEIYAYGIRNPWRIAFDSETGLLWIGDVGQELWEEVNVIRKGGNYGWSVREGTQTFGNRTADPALGELIPPVWEYDHGVGKSITGGRVYRSSRLPQLAGKYIYADYVSGSVWALSYDQATGQATRNEQVIASGIPVLGFGHDPSGEVYYMIDSARGECIYRFEAN